MADQSQRLVSVCMPAHNVAPWIGQAIQSVLNQTYHHIELLVLDDGSSDNTREVAATFADPRLHLQSNPVNLGGYQTVNRSIRLARGDFVAIYHADDIYEPEIIEREVQFLRENPEAGAVFCLDHYIDLDGRIYGGTSLPPHLKGRSLLRFEDIFPHILRNKNNLLRCPTFMARRQVLESVGPFLAERYHVAADLEMWLRLSSAFPIGILDERLMRYRHGKSQWSNRYNRLRVEPEVYFEIMDLYLNGNGDLGCVTEQDRIEHAFNRVDDETFRAVNQVLREEPAKALALLRTRFPWRTFRQPNRWRRKVRVVLLRTLLQVGLRLGASPLLVPLLRQTEYKGEI